MKQKTGATLTKGAAKVPVIMQMEALECGAASLAMIMAYYGKWVPLEKVRLDCGVSRDGSSAKNVLRAARSYGFEAKGYRYEPELLKKEGRFPCIIHWNFNHFVVLDGFKGDKVYLNDPARGAYTVSMEVFDKSFTGVCLMIEPGEGFEPSGKPKSMLAFAKKRLKGTGSAFAFIVLCTFAAALIGILQPGFSRVFLDRLITGKNPEWLYPFFGLLILVSALQVGVSALNTLYLNKTNAKMSAVGSMTFLWKVLHMPMEFFSQRMAGDIQNRQNANANVANQLIGTLAPIVMNALMMIFYLAVMLRYSWVLALLGVCSVVINMFLSEYISRKRVNVARVRMRDAAKLSSATVAGIELIETIKSSGAENGYFERWAGYQASVNAQNARFARINHTLGLLPRFIALLMNTAVLMLGVWFAMRGNFTAGMIMAFQGYLTAFSGPAWSLIHAGQTVQEMRTAMERIEDVMQYGAEEEEQQTENEMGEEEEVSYAKLTGRLEMKDVTFGYSRLAEPVLKGISLDLKPGSRVALVGASGCGKSTISKLISGLYKPWSGEILLDGKPVCDIDRSIFTGSVAVVDQDIILFEDTISNNIKMWDNTKEDFEMILAARDAQLHDDIMQRDGGYQYRLTAGGRDLSGGQRQRLEIARVLAQDPTLIIMDEATSALDAETEYKVVNAVRDRGITCIVVAHRLSTVRDCDEIIVLDQGEIVERGTHEELYARDGYYTKLVSNE